ncbi:MAG: methylenetetrahydrofolate reductase [Propionibacteriaceae bacterium]|jgi:methylenetetrahydrofolate reductase (NADPH)|nr:methylenetetrahydrofolate reductase [Propionibacteriaceae bacterium]
MPITTPATIAELLSAGRRTYSFEFFPPKDQAGMKQLLTAVEQLVPLQPDFVSITYGANGSTRERTIAATRSIAERVPLTIMGHLTIAGQSTDEIKTAIDAYAAAGVRHILALRGDMPGGPNVRWQPHPQGLTNATELVELVLSRGAFCVGVAAFPDIHPSGSPELDVQLLLAKEQAGASFAITQFFFDVKRYQTLLSRLRAHGATLPVIPGLMPITRIAQLSKFAEFSGAALPTTVTSRLQAVASDDIAVRDMGAQIGLELAGSLLDAQAPGLHFFTQNRSSVTREILATLLAGRR